MLILEIAAGVLLGLLLYRGLDSFCKRRNLTMPAGVFAIGIGAVIVCLPIAALLVLGPPIYRILTKPTARVRPVYDLPPDPPGYFWVKSNHKPSPKDKDDPLLRTGHCERDCDSDHPLWLVPR